MAYDKPRNTDPLPGDVAYVWHGGLHAGTVAESPEAAGFAVRSQIIWDKGRLVIGRGDYHWQHEPAWYAVRKGKTGHWEGGRSQTTVWQIPHRKNESGHSTDKPVECMKRPMENNSSPGQAVYEPFSGSGTTTIAAAGLGTRLANTWRSKLFPALGRSIDAAGFVWSKAPRIVGVYQDGAVIRSTRGLFLAIPLPAAGKYADGGPADRLQRRPTCPERAPRPSGSAAWAYFPPKKGDF